MKLVGLLFGIAFGFLIALGGLNEYEVIHNMLLLEDFQPYLIMGSAVVVAAPALWLLERRGFTTPFAGRMRPGRSQVERHHVAGSAIFGTGWAVAGTCPAPALAMTGSGAMLGLVVVGGMFAGLMARDYTETRSGVGLADLDLGMRAAPRVGAEI
ncbi:hypothetical protein BH20ACT23_BH20ACT23_10070 [soil metagenome]